MQTKPLIKTALILSAALVIASCGGGKKSDKPKGSDTTQPSSFNDAVVVQMAVYGKGAGSQVGISPRNNLKQITNRYYASTKTDFINIGYKDNLYHIGRFQIDLIQKYNISSINKGSYAGNGFSPNDAGSKTAANVHDIAFLNDNKAYMTRYGSTKAWVIDPSVQNASQFKTGELDLSAYVEKTDNKSKVPNMSQATVANNKLFIGLQRLGNADTTSNAVRAGYVAVFDTSNNKEVDTKKGKNGLKGIELKIKNPQSMALDGDYLYVSGLTYQLRDSNGKKIPGKNIHEGGIEKINTKTYVSEVIYKSKEVDPTPNNGSVVGKVAGVAVINGTDVYTSIYHSWGNNSLAKVENGELKVIKAFANKNIGVIKTGPDGDLWVGTGLKTSKAGTEQPKLYRLSKTDLSIKDSVILPSNPRGITFIKKQ